MCRRSQTGPPTAPDSGGNGGLGRDHSILLQTADLSIAEAEHLREHLVGVLAESGNGGERAAGDVGEADRSVRGGDGAPVAAVDLDEAVVGDELGIDDDLGR